jgi:hypothetical protein
MSHDDIRSAMAEAAMEALRERVQRRLRRLREARIAGACTAMSRLMAWAFVEATAHVEAGTWNPMPHQTNAEPWMRVYRQRALAIAVESGVLRVAEETMTEVG